MADVTDLKRWREEREPHVCGMARCLDCRHEWMDVRPYREGESNDQWLECPKCTLERGRSLGAFVPEAGKARWVCSCENDLFYCMESGVWLCANCGREHKPVG